MYLFLLFNACQLIHCTLHRVMAVLEPLKVVITNYPFDQVRYILLAQKIIPIIIVAFICCVIYEPFVYKLFQGSERLFL